MATKNIGKKIVQDIVPSDRRSIRKITVNRDKKAVHASSSNESFEDRIKDVVGEENEQEREVEHIQRKSNTKRKSGSFKYLITFIVVFVSIAVIGVALSLTYSKAVVTITPKVTNFDVNGTFTAKSSTLESGENLKYETISVSNSDVQTIPAVKGSLVQTKAKGVAIIYNNFASSTQTLVAGTRLQNSLGNVYRITSTVIVPAKKSTPGSIAVNIVADQPGEKYNLNVVDFKGDFTLPGFKGTPRYNGFYARLKTDVVGGFSGNKMTIDEEAKKTMVKSMQESLKSQLIAKLNESVPKDHILYEGAYNIEYDIPEPVMKSNTDAEITIKATAHAAIFESDSLIKYIAGREIKKFPSDTYYIEGDRELVFNISNSKDFSAKKSTPLIFTLKGPISITGTIPEEKLKDELKGIKLNDSNAVFARYSSIANAYALITPFWLRAFPNSIEKITIEYKH